MELGKNLKREIWDLGRNVVRCQISRLITHSVNYSIRSSVWGSDLVSVWDLVGPFNNNKYGIR
jgi:hypothetical protein